MTGQVITHYEYVGDSDTMTDHWDSSAYPPLNRDFQRCRVYRAETEYRKLSQEKPLTDGQIYEYLQFLKSDPWLKARFGNLQFMVKISKKRKTSACCSRHRLTGRFTLKFPSGSAWITKIVLLHELTHIITRGQKHGPIFCSVLLQLALHFLGTEAGKRLHLLYRTHGVNLCG